MVDNHEENTIQNQLKLFPVYNNQECFFKSPWASISVNSPNRTIHLANDSFSCTSCNPCFTRGILTGFKCSPHIFICVCVCVCVCVLSLPIAYKAAGTTSQQENSAYPNWWNI